MHIVNMGVIIKRNGGTLRTQWRKTKSFGNLRIVRRVLKLLYMQKYKQLKL